MSTQHKLDVTIALMQPPKPLPVPRCRLKYYLEVCEDEEKDSIALADKLRHAVAAELVQPMSFGMKEVQAC